jgi:hypothetical protein
VYDLGSGFLGDGLGAMFEGLSSNWFGAAGFDYASGFGATGEPGGRVIDIATGAFSITDNLISVSIVQASVPEPSTLLLLGCGLVGITGVARRKLKTNSLTFFSIVTVR